MRILLLAVLVGCSGSQRVAGSSRDLGCKVDAAEKAECEGEAGNVYGPAPDHGCGGDPESSEAVVASRGSQPCECMTHREQDERAEACKNQP